MSNDEYAGKNPKDLFKVISFECTLFSPCSTTLLSMIPLPENSDNKVLESRITRHLCVLHERCATLNYPLSRQKFQIMLIVLSEMDKNVWGGQTWDLDRPTGSI